MANPDTHTRHSSLYSLPHVSSFLTPAASTRQSPPPTSPSKEPHAPASDAAAGLTARETPMIRETHYGETLGARSAAQHASWADTTGAAGGPDLVHWGRYHGSRSSQYLTHDFVASRSGARGAADGRRDDGYVGYYHYALGVDAGMTGAQRYVRRMVGIEEDDDDDDAATPPSAAAAPSGLITYCSYNLFHKSDFRARFVVSRSPPRIESSYQIVCTNKKSYSYSADTLSSVPAQYWHELRCSQLVRAFSGLDDPARQPAGLVVWPELVADRAAIAAAVRTLARFLPRGAVTVSAAASAGGFASGWGDKRDPAYVTTGLYKNGLVDALVRVCMMDVSGGATRVAMEAVEAVERSERSERSERHFETRVEDDATQGAALAAPSASAHRNEAAALRADKADKADEAAEATEAAETDKADKADESADTDKAGKAGKVDEAAKAAAAEAAAAAARRANSAGKADAAATSAGAFDYIRLLLLKTQPSTNNEQAFIALAHRHLSDHPLSTQSTLILAEQIKFLLAKRHYATALALAERCVSSMPLDFDCWHLLALCYLLDGHYARALTVVNSLPLVSSHKHRGDIDAVAGVPDFYANTFVERLGTAAEVISERTFEEYFRPPVALQRYRRAAKPPAVALASIDKLWHRLLLFNPAARHPIGGNHFYQSPLMNSTAREISSVDPSLVRLCGPTSLRAVLAAQSSGRPTSSMLDFAHRSTWGRCYDLVCLFVGIVGWDEVVRLKSRVFRAGDAVVASLPACEPWLDQLLLVVYDDLRTVMAITAKEHHHSALEWSVLGLMGWSVKYNLRESVCALITAVRGKAAAGDFDYFGTVQLLRVYDELVLSNVADSHVDLYHDSYDAHLFSNKLLLDHASRDRHATFVADLESQLLTLDFVLLQLMKLVSWHCRWYQYLPDSLVTRVITKLIVKYDPVYLRGKMRIVFESNKQQTAKPKSGKLFGLWGSGKKSPVIQEEFVESDTIVDYMEVLIEWVESLAK
ncbi:Uncharacterized protein ABC855_g4605 [[Candida] zeylanoides]